MSVTESEGKGKIIWFTGYSGAGKSTLSTSVANRLRRYGHAVHVLDGDDLRRGVCADLGFDFSGRLENIRRIAHFADLLSRQGSIVLIAVICPLASLRKTVQSIIPNIIQIFVDAPLAVCETRDPKGLYKKARAGALKDFTGIDALFEPPEHPDLVCHTDQESIAHSTEAILRLLGYHSDRETTSYSSRRPTIAVDFDGVIANYDGWRAEKVFGPPRADVQAALRELSSEGWKIIVHTTREPRLVAPYLRSAKIPFDEINANSDYASRGTKPVATVYWDDRAVYYTGDALVDLKWIREFRTWNGRP